MAGVVGLITSVGEVIYFNDQLNQIKKNSDTLKVEFSNNLNKQHLFTQEISIRLQKEIEALKRQVKNLERNKPVEEEKRPKSRRVNKEEEDRKKNRSRYYSETESENEESEVEEEKDEHEDVNSAARYLLGM